jgi:hypothetical protein
MNKNASFLLLGSVLTVGLSVSTPADATGVGGWQGRFAPYKNEVITSCFVENWGGVTYPTNNSTCTKAIGWEVALPVNAGAYNPKVEVGWPSGNASGSYISCQSNGMPENGSSSSGSFSGWSSPGGTSGIASFQPGSVTVPNYGYLFVNCSMNAGSTLYSINY